MSGLRRARLLVGSLGAAVLVAGCSGGREGALAVTVVFGPRSQAQCAIVTARSGNDERATSPMARDGRGALVVGISPADGFAGAVVVQAHGHGDPACAGPRLESSAAVEAELSAPGVRGVELRLDGPAPPVDGDGDGHPAETDCFDDDPLAYPGAPERCANGKDDDCNGFADCFDTACDGRTCDDVNPCTVGTTCQGGMGCGGGSAVACNTPVECELLPGTCSAASGACGYAFAPAGTACSAGLCNGSGACVSADGGVPDGGSDAGVDGGADAGADAGVDAGVDAGTDAGVDAGVDAGAGLFPYAPSNFEPRTTPPASAAVLNCGTARVVSTGGGSIPDWCGQPAPTFRITGQDAGSAPQLMVIELTGLFVGDAGALTLTGTRPVVLAVYGDATVRGRVVAQAFGTDAPAGASGPSGGTPPVQPWCGTGTGGAPSTNTRTGGGGGGAFGQAGGSGGQGADLTGTAGDAGQANGSASLEPLRGGCAGGNGGPTSADRGGLGGGAVQLSVSGELLVTGVIAAPGQGGQGGNYSDGTNGGGAGAGSGGAVLLEARGLSLQGAAITANGGSGGEGDGNNASTSFIGDDGVLGSPSTATPAPGANGSATQNGGPGGNGGAGATAATGGQNGVSGTNGNGGGGGGGVGRVRLNAGDGGCALASSVVSPPARGNGAPGCPAP